MGLLLDNFFEDKNFNKIQAALQKYESSNDLNAFKIIRSAIGELFYSDLLSYIFHSETGLNLGIRPLQKFIETSIFKQEKDEYSTNLEKEIIEKLKLNEKVFVISTREIKKIDILIEVKNYVGDILAVVAIENKVTPIEQPNQIKTYQQLIYETYPDSNIPKIIYYLTPLGNLSETAIYDYKNCPCIPISFEIIVEFLNSLSELENIDKKLKLVIGQIKNEFYRFLAKHEIIKSVMNHLDQLYRDPFNRRVIRIISLYSGRINTFWKDDLKPLLETWLKENANLFLAGERFEVKTYQNSNDYDFIEEIKIEPRILNEKLFKDNVAWRNNDYKIQLEFVLYRNRKKEKTEYLLQSDDWCFATCLYSHKSFNDETSRDAFEKNIKTLLGPSPLVKKKDLASQFKLPRKFWIHLLESESILRILNYDDIDKKMILSSLTEYVTQSYGAMISKLLPKSSEIGLMVEEIFNQKKYK